MTLHPGALVQPSPGCEGASLLSNGDNTLGSFQTFDLKPISQIVVTYSASYGAKVLCSWTRPGCATQPEVGQIVLGLVLLIGNV